MGIRLPRSPLTHSLRNPHPPQQSAWPPFCRGSANFGNANTAPATALGRPSAIAVVRIFPLPEDSEPLPTRTTVAAAAAAATTARRDGIECDRATTPTEHMAMSEVVAYSSVARSNTLRTTDLQNTWEQLKQSNDPFLICSHLPADNERIVFDFVPGT